MSRGDRSGGEKGELGAYTERFRSSLMALISIFRRPILSAACYGRAGAEEGARGGRECVAIRCASGNQHGGPGRLG